MFLSHVTCITLVVWMIDAGVVKREVIQPTSPVPPITETAAAAATETTTTTTPTITINCNELRIELENNQEKKTGRKPNIKIPKNCGENCCFQMKRDKSSFQYTEDKCNKIKEKECEIVGMNMFDECCFNGVKLMKLDYGFT